MSTALTQDELIASLQHEIRILLHLAGKFTTEQLDYRPTPGQRTALELLRYLTIMGPQLIPCIQKGAFDVPAWNLAEQRAAVADLPQTLSAIAAQSEGYASAIGAFAEGEIEGEIELFGQKASRGFFIVNMVLCGHAAYRTQLFLYLKSCGHDSLNTMNLWAGMDAPAQA